MADNKKNNNDEKLPISQITKLAQILKEQDLTEIEIENDEYGKIKVRRESAPVIQHSSVQAAPALPSKGAAAVNSKSDDVFEVTSPMVGTFYQASTPGAEAFVKVGDKVKKGDTLCIIEAMKLMNELPAETNGEIVEICVSDSQAISFGQLLMKIKKA